MNYKKKLRNISTFVFDVDGVFTDGTVTLFPSGEQVRKMNIKDGYALQFALKKGYKVAIISGGKSEGVKKRFEYLGVEDVYLACRNKVEALQEIMSKHQLKSDEILYMGDDLPDYEVMKIVGLPCCPENAAPEIRAIAEYVSPINGGEGCVRDIIEQCLRVQEQWDQTSVSHD